MSAAASPAAIELVNLGKHDGEYRALSGVNLSIAASERDVTCGPSGSIQSTLICCINRLERHDEGEIRVNGQRLKRTIEI